ncbi:MAG: bifunctional acetate--CoA ligase family protein/GNAT family N-acetyltransferase [Betaproteobacteria bacterium]|nr:bifunctional acetate--CoA ligase family protein/GNAT family N-acetyltransferase [Betaproteobacteria bacterium]
MSVHYLEHLLAPRSIAVIGASERAGSLGRIVFDNLRSGGYAGKLFAVNPKYQSLDGVACHSSIAAIGQVVDLILVTTPAATVPAIVDAAGRAGTRSAAILSAGFGETGPAGKAIEEKLLAVAKSHGLRIIGPNCLGIMRPSLHLNATIARRMAFPGSIALVSQSGAVAAALIDSAQVSEFGFSNVISMGAGIDLDIGEVLDFLTHDLETRSILIYLEEVRNARRFVSALRAAARAKPVIVLKAGRHLQTGSNKLDMSDDAAFDAVLRRCGAVRVRTYAELFSAEQLIGAGRLPRGNRLAVVSNGSGPGVMAADYTSAAGVVIAHLSQQTLAALDACLPAHWSHKNPVDIHGDATAERFAAALGPVLKDEGVDAVLTLFSPQQVLTADTAAQTIVDCVKRSAKPVLTAWLGERDVSAGRSLAAEAKLPVFRSPENAVAAFGTLAEYRMAQDLLLEVPPPLASVAAPDLALAQSIGSGASRSGRTQLNEVEAARLLGCFGIPFAQTEIGNSAKEVRAIAKRIGFPVAIKLLSGDIEHLSDVKGVCLGIRGEETLMREYAALMKRVAHLRPDARIDGVTVQPMVEKRYGRRLKIGVANQPVFGRVISFGAGGVLSEAMQDNAVGLPPLNRRLAQDLVSRTRASHLLLPYRHIPEADTDAILEILLRVSDLVCALPWVIEIEINPLIADESGCIAVDARIVIDHKIPDPDSRFSHLAIHPYPADLESREVLRDGQELHVRPIRPEDATLELAFANRLSERSYYMRFFSAGRGLSPVMLARLTQVDYDRELALIALAQDDEGAESIIGVARYSADPDAESCEFAVTIDDQWNGRGVASLLMRRLMQVARNSGYSCMTGSVLPENFSMLKLASHLGFQRKKDLEDPTIVKVVRSLTDPSDAPPP